MIWILIGLSVIVSGFLCWALWKLPCPGLFMPQIPAIEVKGKWGSMCRCYDCGWNCSQWDRPMMGVCPACGSSVFDTVGRVITDTHGNKSIEWKGEEKEYA